MQELHKHNYQKLHARCTTLLSLKTGKRSDIWKLFENCQALWANLDKEMVECRRRGSVTSKYTEIQAIYDDALNTFDQWSTIAALMQ